MSIFRKFTRKQEKIQSKEKHSKPWSLIQKVGMSLLALGYTFMPSYVEAADVNVTSGTQDIYAQSVNGDIAVNKFDSFNVGTNAIANMYFHKAGETAYANKLFNFVNSKININGTVNAIHNSKIGGDLYFLSKEGMVVGSSGVINAGSLTVMTPTTQWWNDKAANVSATTLAETDVNNISAMAVPINASGTVSVLGNINAHDSVRLKAATVNVGVEKVYNDKGEVIQTNYNKANIKTNTVDFANLVNIKDDNGNTIVNSGLNTDNLALSATTDGKIVLAAENSYNDNNNNYFANAEVNATVNVASGSQIIASGTGKNNTVEISAVATNNRGIKEYTKKVGGVDKKFYEINGNDIDEETYKSLYSDEKTNSFFFMNVATNASVNISGVDAENKTTISGEKVDINAYAGNSFATNQNGKVSVENIIDSASSIFFNGWDVTVGSLNNTAKVDIGDNTKITALGQDTNNKKALNIAANADSNLELGTSIYGLNLISGLEKYSSLSLLPGVAVNYGTAHNNAIVNIAGTLEAENGSTDIKAVANSVFHSTSTTTLPLGAAPVDGFVNLAFNDVTGTNNSSVNITNTADLTKLGNYVDIKANSINDVNVSTNINMGDKGLAAAGLSFTDYRSDATVNIDTAINAKNGITVDAESLYTANEIYTTADAGKSWLWSMISPYLVNSKALGVVSDKINGTLQDSVKRIANGTGAGTWIEDLANMAKVGVAYTSVSEGSHATVNIGTDGKLLAVNDNSNITSNITIAAQSIIRKNHVATIGTSSNAKDAPGSETASVLANGAVQSSTMDSSADIIVAGKTTSEEKLKADTILLKANSESKYDRWQTMKDSISDYHEKADAILDDRTNPKAYAIYSAYKQKLADMYEELYDEDGKLKPEYAADIVSLVKKLNEINHTPAVQRYMELVENGRLTYKDASGQDVSVELSPAQTDSLHRCQNSMTGYLSFLSPESYMTYHVGSSTTTQADTPEDKEKASKLALAISIDSTNLNHNSNILLGKNVTINAKKNLTVESDTVSGDVSMDGKLGFNAGGKLFTAGVNVGIHNLNANSIIAVAENAQLESQNTLNILGKNDIDHIAINPALGMTDKIQLTGNLNYIYANSNTVISIDDEATLSGKNTNLAATNDTSMFNVVGGLAMSGNAAVGIAWNYNEINRNNIIAIADNDAVATMEAKEPEFADQRAEDKSKEDVHDADDAETRAKKLLAYNLDDEKFDREHLFGSKETTIKDAEISAHQLKIDAQTIGSIDVVAGDVGIILQGDSTDPGIGDKFRASKSNLSNRISNKIRTLDNKIAGIFGGTVFDQWDLLPVDQEAIASGAGKTLPTFTLDGSGSIGIVEMDAMTAAVVDNAKIKLFDSNTATDLNKVNVNASDNSSLVNVSGGVGFELNDYSHQAEGFSGSAWMLTGGIAYNDVKSDVVAEIKNSSIDNADEITNIASREGALTSAAAAINAQFSSGTQAPRGVGIAGGGSVNLGDYSTAALMVNNKINTNEEKLTKMDTRKTSLVNEAINKDLQVTGAVDVNMLKVAGKSIGIGLAVSRGYLQNTVKAELDGGEYRKLNNLINNAVTDLTQVGAAVGGGISLGQQGGSGTNVAIQGAISSNTLENVVMANVKNATIDALGMDVKAYDTTLTKNQDHAEKIYNKYKLDTTGAAFIAAAHTDANNEALENHGGTVVGAALQILAAEGSDVSAGVGIGGSVVFNDLDNNYSALVDGITFNKDKGTEDAALNVMAETSNLVVGAVAGVGLVSGTGSWVATGNISENSIRGNITSTVKDSSINAAEVDVDALNTNKIVNVAGSLTLSARNAGISYALNKMDTKTGAYLFDTNIEHTNGVALALNADNNAKYMAIGAGIGASNTGISGSLGINFGNNNVEAIADGKHNTQATDTKDLKDIQELKIESKDESELVAVAGGFYITMGDNHKKFSGAALGGAFAQNEVGHEDKEKKKKNPDYKSEQINKAELANYTITTKANTVPKREGSTETKPSNAIIDVKATDTAHITTVGAGVGIIGGENAKGAIEGAGAYTKLNKDTEAYTSNIKVDDTTEKGSSLVTVTSHEDNTITDVAAVVNAGKEYVLLGAAATYTDTNNNVKAHVDSSTINADNILVDANSKNDLTSVSAGVTAGSSYLTAGGSVTINNLADKVSSYINGGTYNAKNNIGVIANGEEVLKTGAGAFDLNLALEHKSGVGVAAGLSLVKNDFTKNNVLAYVNSATLHAEGSEEDSYKNENKGIAYHDSTTVNDIKEDSNKKPFEAVTQNGYGVVVDAYGKQDVTNVAVTTGIELAIDTPFAIDVAGAVALSEIGGNTEAYIHNSDVNKDETNYGDVIVTAYNNAELDDTAVNVDVSVNLSSDEFAANGAFGIAVAKEDSSRTVKSEIVGSSAINTINAEKLKVKAAATNDIDVTTVGTTVNFTMNTTEGVGLALAANANDNLIYSTNTVGAKVEKINSYNLGMDIEANHFDRIESDSVGVMVAANIPTTPESILTKWTADATVTYTGAYETNTISAELLDSTITHTQDDPENALIVDDIVKANNYSDHDLASTAVAANINVLGLGLAIDTINEKMTDTLTTTVRNSYVLDGSSIDVGAQNKYSVDSHSTQVELGGALSIAVSMHELDASANSSVELDNATITADDIRISNSEERNVKLKKEQANLINVLNIGYARNYVTVNEKLKLDSESEDAKNRQEQEKRIKATLSNIEKGIASQLSRKSAEGGEKRTPLMTEEAAKKITLQGNTGDKVEATGMKTELKMSYLSGSSVAVNNHILDNFDLYTGSGTGSVAGIIKNRAILDEYNRNKISVCDGSINATNVAFNSDISGKAEASTALGYISTATANTSWAKITLDGTNDVEFYTVGGLDGANQPFVTAENIEIKAVNNGEYTSKANGGGATCIGGNELTVRTEDNIDNRVDISGSELVLKAKDKYQSGKVAIEAIQTSNVTATTTFGDVGLVAAGTSYFMDAKLGSDNIVYLANNIIKESETGQSLSINSLFAGKALVKASTGSGAIGGGGSGINANAVARGSAIIQAFENDFNFSNIDAHSLVGGMEKSKVDDKEYFTPMTLAKADISAIDISLVVGADNNIGNATIDTVSITDLNQNTIRADVEVGRLIEYKEKVKQIPKYDEEGNLVYDAKGNIVYIDELDSEGNPIKIQEPVYEKLYHGKTNLKVKADTVAKADADVRGAEVGLGVAVGHKQAEINISEITGSSFVANQDNITYLKSLEVDSSGANTVRLHADGSGGGIFGISPNAATGKSTMDISTETLLGGKINVAGEAEISAKQKDYIDFSVIVKNGGVISVGGADGQNTLTENTGVKIVDADIMSQKANIVASNEVAMNPSSGKGDDNYAVEGNSFAGWDNAAPLHMSNTITDNATVSINNSDIQTTEDLDVLANTVNNVNVKSLYSNGSFTLTEANATAINNHTYTNSINIDKDSSLKTISAGSDISLVAADDSNMQIGAYANAIVGQVSIAEPTTTNTINRNNNINIVGDIVSSNNLNIYSGDYTGIKIGGLDAVIDCEAYSGSLLPIKNRHFTSTVNQNNIVNISGTTRSIQDTDINATEGNVRIKHNYIRGSLFRTNGNQTSEYVSIDRVKKTNDSSDMESGLVNINTNDKVNITGSVTAGVNHDFKLDIGTPTEIVIVSDEDRKYVTSADNDGATVVARPTLKLNGEELSEAEIKNKIGDIKYSSAGVASSLLERFEEVETAISTYSDVDAAHKATDPTYQKLLTERESIISTLSQLGLAHEVEGKWIVIKDIVADVIELPDLISGGGNVIINSDDLVGSGKIKAYGSPELTINNYSNMYLKLNNVTVGELGGKIVVNDHDIDCTSTNTANSSISAALNQTTTKNFSEIVGDNSDNESKIDIQGINSIRKIYGRQDGESEKVSVTPYASIELAEDKAIINKSGSVNVRSLHDSLFINGSVSGTTVSLIADQGNLTQISDKGILSVAGSPEEQYAGKLGDAIHSFDFENSSKVDPSKTYISKEYSSSNSGSSDINDGTNGTITGGNIFLGGIAVNINGLVQSGYEDYAVNITDSSKITEIDNNWNGTPLKDSEIMNSKYMLSEGKAVYDSDKGYCTYQMAAYYNPSTKKIVIPDVEAYGGNISISGNIMSTGNGKILAMDGTYNIKVNNTTDRDLQLGNLMASNVSGKITINDTAKGTKTEYTKNSYSVTEHVQVTDSSNQNIDKLITTEYTKDGYTVYDHSAETRTAYTASGYTVIDYKNLTTDGQPTVTSYEANDDYVWDYTYNTVAASQYNPLANIRYNWNYGTYTASKEFKEHKYEANWWGIRESVDEIYQKGVVVKTEPNETYNKEQIAYTSIDASLNDTDFYVFGSDSYLSQSKSDIKETRWETGLFGFRKHILYEWNETTGSSQQYMASVKADNKINIGFMGKNSATIDVDSIASIDMTGNIGSEQKDLATVNINSTKGHLTQNSSSIMADNVNLQAAGHMKGINIRSGQVLNLTAENIAAANTEYYFNGNKTSVSDGNNIDINIKTDVVTNESTGVDYGKVNLNGLVGNADKELVHSINIKASGSIDQENNGLIAGRRVDIEATNGQIGTNASSVKVDTGDDIKTADTLSASLNAKARGDINLQETAGDLRIGTIYSDNGDVYLKGAGSLVDALPYENIEASGRSDEELVAHWDSMGLIDDSMQVVTDDQGKALTTTVKNNYPVVVTRTEKQEDGSTKVIREQQKDAAGNPLYYRMEEIKGWNPDKLLYAISDEIINPKSGVEMPTKTANIKAHSISIEVGSSAGLNSNDVWERNLDTIGSNLDDLNFLAKQDASNVQWNAIGEDGERTGKVVVQQKLPIGVLQSNDGTLTIKAGQNKDVEAKEIYVEARPVDAVHDTHMDMNIMNITTQGDVLLKNALGGIYTAPQSQTQGENPIAVISANKLDINAGGQGSINNNIGSHELPLYVDTTGYLHATSTDDVNIYQVGENDLLVLGVSANGNIALTSDKGILGFGSASTEHTARGYIRLEGKDTNLTLLAKDGNVGNATSGRINVVNKSDNEEEGHKIIVEAHHNNNGEDDGSVYLYGNQNPTTSNEPGGTLYVDSIIVGKNGIVDLDSYGTINVNADKLNAKDVKLTAAKDVVVTAQNLHWYNVDITAGKHPTAESSEIKNYGGDVTITAGSIDLGKVGSSIKATKAEQMDPSQTKGNVTITATNSYLKNNSEISADSEISMHSAEQLLNTAKLQALGGKIDLVAGSEAFGNEQPTAIINNSGDLSANGNITLKAYGEDLLGGTSSVYNTGAISSPSYVNLQSINGGITNLGAIGGYIEHEGLPPKQPNSVTFDAKTHVYNGVNEDNIDTIVRARSVKITTKTGSVDNFMHVISTTGNAQITAGDSVVNKGFLIAESSDAIIKAGDFIENYGEMSAYNGSVTITSEHGSIYNKDSADLLAGNGNVTIETKAAVGETKASIINEGDLAANGNITIKSTNGDIYNRDRFDLYVDKLGNSMSISTKDVVIDAPNGAVNNTQDIIAAGSVDITAKTGLSNFAYDVIAGGDINLTATTGNLINNTELISESGNITLEAEKGTVVNLLGGDIFALGIVDDGSDKTGGNVTMKAGGTADSTPYLVANSDFDGYKTGQVIGTLAEFGVSIPEGKDENIILLSVFNGTSTDIYIADTASGKGKKKIGTVAGNVDVFRQGDVVNRGDVVAMGQTVVETVGGDEVYSTKVSGMISIESAHGNVTNYDNFSTIYDPKTGIETDSYQRENDKFLMSTGGIGLKAPEGYFYNNFDYIAGGDLVLEAKKDITIGDDFSIGKVGGNLIVTSSEGKIVNNAASFDVDGSITLDGTGGVETNSNIEAGKDVNLYSQDGNIVIGDKSDLSIISKDGNVRIWAGGNVVASNDKISAENGSAIIGSTAGDVAVDKVEAGQMAAVGSKGGNVKANEIQGAQVAVYNGTEGSKADIYKIEVSDFLILQSDSVNIDELERTSESGYLYIDATGANGGTMKDDFNMNVKGDVWFTALNVNNADVKVGGDLAVERLHVEGEADFVAHNYNTTVYGTNPAYNGAKAIYYDNGTGEGSPSNINLESLIVESADSKQGVDEQGKSLRDDKQPAIADLQQMLQNKETNRTYFSKGANDGWMNLYIDGARDQSSNGLLLHVDDKHYVHNQRYSAESIGKILTDYKPEEDFQLYNISQVPMFERYNLYELPSVQVVNGQLKNTLVEFVLADDKDKEEK